MTSPITDSASRDAFEEWAKYRGIYVARREDIYPDSNARHCWDVWKAAWKAAINAQS